MPKHHRRPAAGPSQRQLRIGELIRHALSEIFLEGRLHDEALAGVLWSVTEARMTPDLKHARVYVRPLGEADPAAVVKSLGKHARFLRGELARRIEMRHVPDLAFALDTSFDTAAHIESVLHRPEVQRDLERGKASADDEPTSEPES